MSTVAAEVTTRHYEAQIENRDRPRQISGIICGTIRKYLKGVRLKAFTAHNWIEIEKLSLEACRRCGIYPSVTSKESYFIRNRVASEIFNKLYY